MSSANARSTPTAGTVLLLTNRTNTVGRAGLKHCRIFAFKDGDQKAEFTEQVFCSISVTYVWFTYEDTLDEEFTAFVRNIYEKKQIQCNTLTIDALKQSFRPIFIGKRIAHTFRQIFKNCLVVTIESPEKVGSFLEKQKKLFPSKLAEQKQIVAAWEMKIKSSGKDNILVMASERSPMVQTLASYADVKYFDEDNWTTAVTKSKRMDVSVIIIHQRGDGPHGDYSKEIARVLDQRQDIFQKFDVAVNCNGAKVFYMEGTGRTPWLKSIYTEVRNRCQEFLMNEGPKLGVKHGRHLVNVKRLIFGLPG